VRHAGRVEGATVRAWVLLLASALLPPVAASGQTAADPPYPPPGRLVDIGGWRLHLNCTGTAAPGQPTVVLEAGIGAFSVEWALLQPRVAPFARVCSYDRAGVGWSELGPAPRTRHQMAFELHTLLERAGERAPYLLVGQSFGGSVVRLYAAVYRSEVAGMVLVDTGHLTGVSNINGELVRLSERSTGRPIPPPAATSPFRESELSPNVRTQIEAAARQNGPQANEPPRDRLPDEAQRMRVWALSQVKHYVAHFNPFDSEELALLVAEQDRKEHPFGDLPLVVLSRGTPAHTGDSQWIEDERVQGQVALAKLSRRGRQVIAVGSGHHIQIEDPELVVSAIREVLSGLK
jgi:pimeloyl-ACP methyl ester carboxylesterase